MSTEEDTSIREIDTPESCTIEDLQTEPKELDIPEDADFPADVANSDGEGINSDAVSETPEAGEFFDLRDFFFEDAEAEAEAEAENSNASPTTTSRRARRRGRRRDTFVLVEDLPTGVDFDEPVEVEKMTRAGKITNFLVSVAFVLFLFAAMSVLGNATMTVMVALNPPQPESIEVKVYDLDKAEGKLDVKVTMPETFYTRFLSISKAIDKPLSVKVYLPLPNEADLKEAQRICTLYYHDDEKQPEKRILYDGSKKVPIVVKGVNLRLNPQFNASRLGLLVEDKQHVQRPTKMVIKVDVDIQVMHIMMPFTISFTQPFEFDLSKTPPADDPLFKAQTQALDSFNFNPAEIKFSQSADKNLVHVQLEQPLPNCLLGSGIKIEAEVPSMNLEVFEFNLPDRSASFTFDSIANIYKPLATIKTGAFSFQEAFLGQKAKENQLAFGQGYAITVDADLDAANAAAVNDVLAAVRDNQLDNLAFLIKVKADDSKVVDLKAQSIDFVSFMRGFWLRFPYPKADPSKFFPGLPEDYNKASDAALKVHFAGVEADKEELKFEVTANVFYIISQYGLPVSLLGGEIPAISFDLYVKEAQGFGGKVTGKLAATVRVENFKKIGSKEIEFIVKVKLQNLKLAALFATKFVKLKEINSAIKAKEPWTNELQDIVGAEFVARAGDDWVSGLVSAFNMEFAFKAGGPEIVYKDSQQPVIPTIEKTAEEITAICHSRRQSREDLLTELKIDLHEPRLEKFNYAQEERFIRAYISKSKLNEEQMKLVRHKLQRYLALTKNCPEQTSPKHKQTGVLFQNRAKVGVLTEPFKAEVTLRANLHMLIADSPVFEDKILFSWSKFVLSFATPKAGTPLFTLDVGKGSLGYLLQSGRIFSFQKQKLDFKLSLQSVHDDDVDVSSSASTTATKDGKPVTKEDKLAEEAKIQARKEAKRSAFLNNWTDFFFALMEGSRESLVAKTDLKIDSVSWPLALPSMKLLALTDTAVPTSPPPASSLGFFGKLTNTLVDFIGYGQYSMLFNALLPNPRVISFAQTEGTVWNCHLSIPDTSIYLFSEVKNAHLRTIEDGKGPILTGSLKTNDYLVRVSDGQVESVFALAKPDVTVQPSMRLSQDDSWLVLRNFRQDSKQTVLNVAALEFRFVDFGRIMDFTERIGKNERIHIGAGNPLSAAKQLASNPDEPIQLWSAWLSVLASKWQIVLNDEEAVKSKLREGSRILDVSKVGALKLNTAVSSTSPYSFNVHAGFSLPESATASRKVKAEPFQHPIIRWGATDITFMWRKQVLKARLKISAGEIEIAEGGSKVFFDALSKFKVSLHVELPGGGPSKDVGRFRKAVRRVLNFDEVTGNMLSSATVRELYYQLAYYAREGKFPNDVSKLLPTSTVVALSQVTTVDGEVYKMGGLAKTSNFFDLFRVLVQMIFAPTPPGTPDDPSTQVDFSMLVSFDPRHPLEANCIPRVLLPCFMPSFCSTRQVHFSPVSRAGHFEDRPIPVQLQIRNTFQPLTAAIAKGMASFLTAFHFDCYPPQFEWNLDVKDAQVLGLEINGQALVAGRAKPFKVTRTAPIPYPNTATAIEPPRLTPSTELTQDIMLPVDSNLDPATYDEHFFPRKRPAFNDVLCIEAEAVIPDTFAPVLRKMLSSLFVPGADPSVGLQPPLLMNPAVKLVHAPTSVALSNAVSFIDPEKRSKVGTRLYPSLLAGLFAAFMEEVSGPGMDLHSPAAESSPMFMKVSLTKWQLGYEAFFKDSLNFSVWMRFPWPLSPIGFDFGKKLNFSLRVKNKEVGVVNLGRHYFEGKTSYLRFDFEIDSNFGLANVVKGFYAKSREGILASLPQKPISYLSSFLSFFATQSGALSEVQDSDVSIVLNLNDDFVAESEITLPLRSMLAEPASSKPYSRTPAFGTLTEKIQIQPTDAYTCVFNHQPTYGIVRLHQNRWSRLNLARTRLFYLVNGAHHRGIDYHFALQLRTNDHRIICGFFEDTKKLSVVFVYEPPLLRLRSVLGSFGASSGTTLNYKVKTEAAYQGKTSVYLTKSVKFDFPGRYSVYIKFAGKGELVKVENAEIYIVNPR